MHICLQKSWHVSAKTRFSVISMTLMNCHHRQPDSFLLLIACQGANYSMLYCYRSTESKDAVQILNAQQLRNSAFVKNLAHHKWNERGM